MADAGQWKYFAPMLHEDDDELDPYEYRLLGHYRRVCGQGGVCCEATRTTADRTRISSGKVSQVRASLKAKGRIHVDDSRAPVLVTLVDRWTENVARYEACSHDEHCSPHEQRSPDEQTAGDDVHPMSTCPETGGGVHRMNMPPDEQRSPHEQPGEGRSPHEHEAVNSVHHMNTVHQVNQGTYKDSAAATDLEPKAAAGSFAQAGAREDAPNIFELYDRHGIQPPLSDLQRDVLLDAAATYSADQIDYAFRDAADHGKRSWPYIRAILERLRTSPESPKVAGRIEPTASSTEADRWRAAAAEHNPVDESGNDLPATGETAPAASIPGTLAARLFAAPGTANLLDTDATKAWEAAHQQISLQLGRGPDWARWQGVTALRFADDVLTLGVEDATAARDFQNRLYRFLAGRVRDSFERDVRLVFETLVEAGRPALARDVNAAPPRDRASDHSVTPPDDANPPRPVGQAAWMQTLLQEREKEPVN